MNKQHNQGSFFSELKRRNVVRVAAFYLLAAWLMIQVADALFGLLGVPDWCRTASRPRSVNSSGP